MQWVSRQTYFRYKYKTSDGCVDLEDCFFLDEALQSDKDVMSRMMKNNIFKLCLCVGYGSEQQITLIQRLLRLYCTFLSTKIQY